jgi:ATP-dependent RNA helicase RhlE
MNTTNEFQELGLSEHLLNQVKSKGYKVPTPIQSQAIPSLLEGKDLIGIAQTGSGKTAAFSLPILELFGRNKLTVKCNHVRSLILSPTRELATQIENNIKEYGADLDLRTKVVFGGVGKGPQVDAINLGLDILVATPGRLLDLIDRGHLNFSELEIFVLDEADMMLDMGFLGDVKKVISFLPKKKQTLLFSATMPPAIEELASNLLSKPVKIKVNEESSIVDTIDQKIYSLDKVNKGYLLNALLQDSAFKSVLLFCKTKFGADKIIEQLEKVPVTCAAIHSRKAQGERELALSNFREGKIRVLVATDIAARGIDIKNVSHVINFNLPEDPKSYIHRIGRTGRAGEKGTAISFLVESEVKMLKNIEVASKQKFSIDPDQPFHRDFSIAVPKAVQKSRSKNGKRRFKKKK